MDHIKRHRAQIASQIFGSYGSVSVDDAIEKAIPVGTVNKYGKMKMPDGSWKYVGKGKTEGAQAKKDEALKHHVEEGKKMSADEVTAFIKKHGKAGTMPSDEELKRVSDAHKHLREAERRSPKALKEAIKTSQEAYADDSKKKDVKEHKLSDGSKITAFKVGDTKVTEIESTDAGIDSDLNGQNEKTKTFKKDQKVIYKYNNKSISANVKSIRRNGDITIVTIDGRIYNVSPNELESI